MGNVSVIARRLDGGKYVQYGWGGNGGYYSVVGARLLSWYDDPEKVDYLFDLGQMRVIGKPGSENGGASLFFTNAPTGEPHWLGKSEREIFSKIAFVDYGYFYDNDHRWYYVIPGPFRIKIPLDYIDEHLDERKYEFDTCRQLEREIMEFVLGEYYEKDTVFKEFLNKGTPGGVNTVRQDVLSDENPVDRFWERYRVLFHYFDDWVIVNPSQNMKDVQSIMLMPRQESTRKETIEWKSI